MKRKRIVKRVVVIVIVVLALYLFWAVKVGYEVRKMVQISNEFYGANVLDSDNIPEDIYQSMCYRDDYTVNPENNPDVSEDFRLSFPIALHWVTGAKVYYHYTYEITDVKTGECIGGSYDVPVELTVKVTPRGLIYTDYYEKP